MAVGDVGRVAGVATGSPAAGSHLPGASWTPDRFGGPAVSDRCALGAPPSQLVLVCGAAGTGKTTVARAVAPCIGAAHLDKDVLSGPLVSALMDALGGDPSDRDSVLYRQECRPLEYVCLVDTSLALLSVGVSVVADAPFIPEVRGDAWPAKLAADVTARHARLVVVWVSAPPEMVQARLSARALARDSQKLADWDAYLATADPQRPPTCPHVVLHNDLGLRELNVRARSLGAWLSVP